MGPRILIVDDHEIVREGLRNLLSQSRPGWVVCGQARNGEEAVSAVRDLAPDAVLLDITMPIMSGLEAARRITKSGAACRILMFTMHESDSLDREVRDAGAQGFVLKSQAARNLVVAIETILDGGTFFGVRAKH
jgi:DNA-binding NarL/FixJ family response regulator